MPTNVFVTLKPGDLMADYVTRVTPKVLNARGIKGVFRYIDGTCGSSSPSPKCLTTAEMMTLLAGGIAVTPVFEKYAARCLEGHSAGLFDGKAAVSDLTFLKYPAGTNILVAFDTDITKGNLAGAIGYWQAFCDVAMQSGFRCSIYGDKDLLDAVLSLQAAYHGVTNVQANARGWSWNWIMRKWGGLSSNAHLDQQPQANGMDIDKVVKPIQVFAGVKP